MALYRGQADGADGGIVSLALAHTALVTLSKTERQARASELAVPLRPEDRVPSAITVTEADGAERTYHYCGVYKYDPAFLGWKYDWRGATLILLDDR